jgi:hypothetical protein
VKKNILVLAFVINTVYTGYAGSNPFPFFDFSNIEFLVGIKGGINFTTPLILNRYSVFENTSDNASTQFKTYGKWFKNIGNQFGILLIARFGETNYLMLQPALTTHVIKYTGLYEWQNASNPNESSNLTYMHKQSLKYLEIPIIYRKEMGQQTLRPYLQGGAFYGLLQNATQNVDIAETMTIGQTTNEISGGNRSGSSTSQFIRTHIGVMAGAGLAYHFNSVIVCLDGLYKLGLNNITNEKNRYTNQPIVGDTFDVPDDISLNALMVSVNIIFKIGNPNKKRALKCP